MTEEEIRQKAEEYADRHAIIHTKDVYIEIQDAYIAGATENGIQWHDLRKNPNDLPKKYGKYWVCRNQSYSPNTVTQEIQYGRVGWCTDCANDVIAWCEEPQFKE